MSKIAKYNLFKGISTIVTLGTPIITLICTSDFFVHRPETAISATGIFTILITMIFLKDKIAENFKMPSAFILSLTVFILILLIENIIEPIKMVSLMTMLASGIDELSFKRIYKSVELQMPENIKSFKHIGFIFTSSNKLLGEDK